MKTENGLKKRIIIMEQNKLHVGENAAGWKKKRFAAEKTFQVRQVKLTVKQKLDLKTGWGERQKSMTQMSLMSIFDGAREETAPLYTATLVYVRDNF